MSKIFNKICLILLACMLGWFGSIQKLCGQITVDSLKNKIATIPTNANTAKFSEAIMPLQGMIYSDTLLELNQRLIASTRARVGDKDPLYAMSLTGMAILYMFRGKYEKSFPLLQQSMTIMKEASAEEKPQYAIILNNLAMLYEKMGQHEKAKDLYEKALALRKKLLREEDPQYPLLFPLSLSNLASLYMKMGAYEKSLPLFQQALDIREKKLPEGHPYYFMSLNNLAQLYTSMHEYQKALPLFQQALEVYEKKFGKEDIEYITGLENLAALYKDMGDYGKALPLFEEISAWRIKTLGEEHPGYASGLSTIGVLKTIAGNPADALSLFIKADNITLKHLSETYSSLSEHEKITFLNQESSQFHYLPSLLSTRTIMPPEVLNQVYKTELTLKGMVLEDQQQVLRSVRQNGDSNALILYNKWRFNKALLSKQLLLPKTKRVSYIDSIEENTNYLEQQLSQRSTAFLNLQHIKIINAKDISFKLVKGQAAVEFFRFKLYNKKWTDSIMYAAMVLLPEDSNARFIPLFEEKELLRVLRPSVNATDAVYRLYPSKKSYSKKPGAIDSLYQLIWKPLEKYLKTAHTINYAPAGLLHRIAFHALRTNSTHLLIDDYQLNQFLSTRSVALPVQTNQKIASAGIWGNIEYNLQANGHSDVSSPMQGTDTSVSFFNFYTWDTRGLRNQVWGSLPASKKEMDSIGNVLQEAGFHVSTNSGTVATEEEFKRLDGKSPQVLHIATHGFFLPVVENNPKINLNAENNYLTVQQNPMLRSGLVLAGGNHAWKGEAALSGREDGILTSYEIAQMDLSNTDLLVLSACETALGDLQGNEGVIGLQRAFKMAGVKQMILSLWRVPDKETMELMTMFYKNWTSGQSPREALRSAQLKMREKYSPYYWAAFVLVE